ncbi:YIP1 family protein [Aerococcus viridans]|uniref:YIP1 family protein n=1 Tax=Aerococcus viridans TaxID=1377 RepID=UPI003AA84849
MKRKLTGKEKLYTVLLIIIQTVISIFVANKTLTESLAQQGLEGGEFPGLPSYTMTATTTVVSILGILLGALILFWFLSLLKSEGNYSYGLILFIDLLSSLPWIVIHAILTFILSVDRMLQFAGVFDLVGAIITSSLLAFLLYKYEVASKKKTVIFAVVIIVLNLLMTLASTALA